MNEQLDPFDTTVLGGMGFGADDPAPRCKHRKSMMVLWCDACRRFVPTPGGYNGYCAACGRPLLKLRCTRCGTEWFPRNPLKLPKTCANPNCKSPYYNRERERYR